MEEQSTESARLMELPPPLLDKVVGWALGGPIRLERPRTAGCCKPLPLAKQTLLAPHALMKRLLATSHALRNSTMQLTPSITLTIRARAPDWPAFVMAAIQHPTGSPLRLSIHFPEPEPLDWGTRVGSYLVLEALQQLQSCPRVHEIRLQNVEHSWSRAVSEHLAQVCPNLKVVTLGECGLHFQTLEPLLKRASVVHLNRTRVDGWSPNAVLGAGFALRSIGPDEQLVELFKLPNIQALHLNRCSMPGFGYEGRRRLPAPLAPAPVLTTLTWDNACTSHPLLWVYVNQMTALKEFNTSDIYLGSVRVGPISDRLGLAPMLGNLTKLTLYRLSDEGIRQLAPLPQLRTVGVHDMLLTQDHSEVPCSWETLNIEWLSATAMLRMPRQALASVSGPFNLSLHESGDTDQLEPGVRRLVTTHPHPQRAQCYVHMCNQELTQLAPALQLLGQCGMLYSFQTWKLGLQQLQVMGEQCPAAGASIQELIVVELEEIMEMHMSSWCSCVWPPRKPDPSPQEGGQAPESEQAQPVLTSPPEPAPTTNQLEEEVEGPEEGAGEVKERGLCGPLLKMERLLQEYLRKQREEEGTDEEQQQQDGEGGIQIMEPSLFTEDSNLYTYAIFVKGARERLMQPQAEEEEDESNPPEVVAVREALWRTLPAVKVFSIGKRGDEPAYLRAVGVDREQAVVRLFQDAPRNCIGRIHFERDVKCGQRLARLLCEGGCPWVDVIVNEQVM